MTLENCNNIGEVTTNHRIRNKFLRLVARWKEINKRRLELPVSSFSGYTDGPLLKLLASLPCYAGFLRWRVKSYQNQFHPILQIYRLALWFPRRSSVRSLYVILFTLWRDLRGYRLTDKETIWSCLNSTLWSAVWWNV